MFACYCQPLNPGELCASAAVLSVWSTYVDFVVCFGYSIGLVDDTEPGVTAVGTLSPFLSLIHTRAFMSRLMLLERDLGASANHVPEGPRSTSCHHADKKNAAGFFTARDCQDTLATLRWLIQRWPPNCCFVEPAITREISPCAARGKGRNISWPPYNTDSVEDLRSL